MHDDVTVIIPHIPTREHELLKAVASVHAQTHQPRAIIITTDTRREGSAITRNRALFHVSTPWVAFLDDDDLLMPNHLQLLISSALAHGADVVYSGCVPVGPDGQEISRRDEWGRFGYQFNPDMLRQVSYIPVTSLVRTGLAVQALFGPPEHQPHSEYDDWGFYLRLLDLGAIFKHVPEVSWIWHHHGDNTSGRSDRW